MFGKNELLVSKTQMQIMVQYYFNRVMFQPGAIPAIAGIDAEGSAVRGDARFRITTDGHLNPAIVPAAIVSLVRIGMDAIAAMDGKELDEFVEALSKTDAGKRLAAGLAGAQMVDDVKGGKQP